MLSSTDTYEDYPLLYIGYYSPQIAGKKKKGAEMAVVEKTF